MGEGERGTLNVKGNVKEGASRNDAVSGMAENEYGSNLGLARKRLPKGLDPLITSALFALPLLTNVTRHGKSAMQF